MMQVAPERDQVAWDIAAAIWGEELAEGFMRRDDNLWLGALRAADAVLKRRGKGPRPPARLFLDEEREGYRFLKPAA